MILDSDAISTLARLGWLPETTPPDGVFAALEEFGKAHGAETLKQAARLLTRPRCGIPDVLPRRVTPCRWNVRTLRVQLAYPDFAGRTARDWAALAMEAIAWFEPYLPFAVSYVGPRDRAHVRMTAKPIDLAGFTIGLAELPCGADENTLLGNWLDIDEPWGTYTRALAVETIAHEFGHTLGLEHDRDPTTLMAPYASGNITALTEGDIGALRDTYPEPRLTPAPGPAAQPTMTKLKLIEAQVMATDAKGGKHVLKLVP